MVLKLGSVERLKNLVLQIWEGLQSDRKADETVGNPMLLPLFLRIW